MSADEVVVKRGRGRPKKVVDETVAEAKKTGTRKASTKATKAVKSEEGIAKKPAKAAPKATKSTKTPTLKVELKPAKTTPAAPSSSKILQEVAAKGTLKTEKTTTVPVPQPRAQAQPPAQSTKPLSPLPCAPKSQSPSMKPTSPLPFTSQPTPKPTSDAKEPAKVSPNLFVHRPTVIAIPPKPLPYRAQPEVVPPPKEIPGPNFGPLPKKYKAASRKVTAIIVGLPILFVTSYELWRRWDPATIRHKYSVDTPRRTNQIETPAATSTERPA